MRSVSLWAIGLTSDYIYFESSYLQGPTWDLSAVTSATLTFWHWLEVEWCTSGCGSGNPTPTSLDGAQVTCWNGSGWELAAPSGGYAGVIRIWDSAISPDHPLKDEPGFPFDPNHPTQGAVWREAIIDLPAACLVADARVALRFGSDSGSTGNGSGWFIDDVALVGTCN